MPRPLVLLLAGFALTAATTGATPGPALGVYDAEQAHVDYMLECQGCHRPDGSGDDQSSPPLHGMVARFLAVPGGREFLGRVPGVATANLDDARLANLLNWTLYRFDSEHVPGTFRPYTAAELGKLRQDPLRVDRLAMRARLVAGFTTTPKQ